MTAAARLDAVRERLAQGGPMTGLDLRGCDLSSIDFTGAVLEECRLSETRIAAATWDGAAILRCDLSGSDWAGMTSHGILLMQCDL